MSGHSEFHTTFMFEEAFKKLDHLLTELQALIEQLNGEEAKPDGLDALVKEMTAAARGLASAVARADATLERLEALQENAQPRWARGHRDAIDRVEKQMTRIETRLEHLTESLGLPS